MPTIAVDDFTNNLFTLLKETFEGPAAGMPSAFLDQGGGLFQTLDRLSASDASKRARPDGATIAGQCEHLRFYVEAFQRFMHGATERVDWSRSWLVGVVSEEEWASLKSSLRETYDGLMADLQSIEIWGDEPVGDAMAIVVHTAYHLGAIRQMIPIVAARS